MQDELNSLPFMYTQTTAFLQDGLGKNDTLNGNRELLICGIQALYADAASRRDIPVWTSSTTTACKGHDSPESCHAF